MNFRILAMTRSWPSAIGHTRITSLVIDKGETTEAPTVYRGRKAPVTPGLRPGYDLPATEKWANRRKNVRLVAEVVRLVAEVVGDRKGQISRNVDGHVQNLKPAIPNRKRSHD